MSDTVFVPMYHPALGNVQVDAPLQAVATYQSHGWLLVDPNATPPPVASPYLSQPAADSRYLRDWAGAEVLTAGAVRVAPDGHVIVRVADGTTRSSYDTTEAALWTALGGANDPTPRAAYGLVVAATVTASGALVAGKHNPVDASGGAKTMTLPTGAVEGASIGVEKLDSSANAVTVTGNIRGASGQSISLPWAHETLVLRADATGSWWPVSGHKTKASLDGAYVAATSFAAFGAKGDNFTDNSAAWASAMATLGPLVGTVFERTLVIPEGTFLSNSGLTSNTALKVFGLSKLGTRLKVGPLFPSGGTLLSFIKDGSSPVTLEGKVPHLELRNLTLDGGARAVQASALHLDFFDRAVIQNVYIDSFAGSAITGRCVRESLVNVRTWLCGDATHPTLDVDETGSTISEGSNLNVFHGCEFLLNMGDDVRFRAPYGVVQRNNTFVQCVFHGLNEWIEDYADEFGNFSLGTEGNVSARIVIDNSRNIVFDACRFHLNGRAQPKFYLTSGTAGANTINSATIANSVMSYRGAAYSSRSIASVDATTDQFTLAGVNLPGRHQLQTGSRIQFASTTTGIPPSAVSLPGGITAGLDYYAIKVDDNNFKVAATRSDALNGIPVDVTSTGGGVVTQYDTAVTVDTGLDTLTAPDHRLTTGARFRVAGTAVPGGLAAATDYFVIRVDKDTIKLATTRANAIAGTAIDLTSGGTQVFLSPQDFVAGVEAGTLIWGSGNIVEGSAPARGYFRIEDSNSPAGKVIYSTGTSWAAGSSAPVAEYATGASPYTIFETGISLVRNNTAIQMADASGVLRQVAKYTPGGAMQFGTLTGTDNAQLVAGGIATIFGGGSERFRASSTGLSFYGQTTTVAKPTITGSRGGNAALASFLTAVASQGLITDSTTA